MIFCIISKHHHPPHPSVLSNIVIFLISQHRHPLYHHESMDYLLQLEGTAKKLVADHHAEQNAKAAATKAEKLARHTVTGRLTGGFLWPNAFLPPIPRMRPQPAIIDGMYRHRLRAKDRRLMRLRDADDAIFRYQGRDPILISPWKGY